MYRTALTQHFRSARTPLTGLRSAKSCEALMPGKRPGVRLLARVVCPLNFQPDPLVMGFLSEPFVITTNRAKGRGEGTLVQTAPVQRLPGVGTETARKLKDFPQLRALLHSAKPSGLAEGAVAGLMDLDTVETVVLDSCSLPCDELW